MDLRFAQFLTSFFVFRNELSRKVRYDIIYQSPTSFREESDFQKQIKNQGFSLLYEPRATIIHEAFNWGGNRPRIKMGERLFWKAHNNAVFILKWNKSTVQRFWFLFCSSMILILYKPIDFLSVFKGVKKGIETATVFS